MEVAAQQKIIKSAYKETEIGVIPEDWEVSTIGDVVRFSGGSQPPRSTFRFVTMKGFVRLIQIRDYKTDDFATFIPESLARKRCTADDIMIGRYGPPIFQILRGIDGAYNVALIKATPSTRIDREYLFHVLKQDSLFRLIESLSQRSSGQTGIEMPALKGFPLPLPPVTEQRVIAEALRDVDKLIHAQDKYIAKKRDIKLAAMQQLLTGKVRLPGFSDDWQVKTIGEFTGCISGGTPSTSIPRYWGGAIKWMSSGELHLKMIWDVEGRITESGLKNSSAKMVPPGCVLIGLAGQGKTRGTVAFNMVPLCTNQSIAAVLPNNQFVSKYLYHNLDSRYEELRSLSTGAGGRGGINLTIIKSVSVPFPTVKEQEAIATVLSEMDAEITALEQKRDKTHSLKQGMMQELLTGKKRLV